MPEKAVVTRIPVWKTVSAAWAGVVTRPGPVFRLALLPVAAAVVLPQPSGLLSHDFARGVATGLAVFALLIVTMVAWQRIALFGPESRKGWLPLRIGRAELLAILHFPLVAFLFVPWQAPAMVAWLVRSPAPSDLATLVPWLGFAVLVFPGGLILARAGLMLPAFAAAGSARAGLIETADRIWATSRRNSLRVWFALFLATLPFVAVSQALSAMGVEAAFLPGYVRDGLGGAFATLYLLVAGGAYAEAWRALGGVEPPAAKKKPPAKPAKKKSKRKRAPGRA